MGECPCNYGTGGHANACIVKQRSPSISEAIQLLEANNYTVIKNSVPPAKGDDRAVLVCDLCNKASCWKGEFMCDDANCAGVKHLTVRQLKTLNLEHERFWE